MAQVGEPLFMIDVPDDQVPKAKAAASEPEKKAAAAAPPPPPAAAAAPPPVAAAPVAAAAPQAVPVAAADPNAKILTTPTVRRLAKEHGIDLSLVAPTGKNGRVLKDDILAYIASAAQAARPTEPSAAAAAAPSAAASAAADDAAYSAPPLGEPAADTVEPIRGMQRLMVKSMEASLAIPHFGYVCPSVVHVLASCVVLWRPIVRRRSAGARALSSLPSHPPHPPTATSYFTNLKLF